jgi:hypothetical protein
MMAISIFASRGRRAASIVARAGGSFLKYWADQDCGKQNSPHGAGC